MKMKNLSRLQHLKALRSKANDDMTCSRLVLAKTYIKNYQGAKSAYIDYAGALMQLARYKEAEKALEKAISICPKDKLFVPYAQMGHLNYSRGDYQEAAKWFTKCIKKLPNDATGYIYKGSALAKCGKLKSAENAHRKATQCREGCIDEAYLNLGYVLRAQEKYTEALPCFAKALEIDPKYKEAKRAMKDVEKAIEYETLLS